MDGNVFDLSTRHAGECRHPRLLREYVRDKGGWIYIFTNRPNGTLYIGVTSVLIRRVSQHRSGEIAGFTQRYGLKMLVYFERYDSIVAAITREKAMKEWPRAWKVRLIMRDNPEWRDLYDGIL